MVVAGDPLGLTDLEKSSYVFETRHQDLRQMYKRLVDCRWTVEEIDLSNDRVHFQSMEKGEQHFLLLILSFFKGGDGVVIENTFRNFMKKIVAPEARAFYTEQLSNETVHSEMYKILVETFARDRQHAENLLRDIESFESVRAKMQWAEKWLNKKVDFRARLVAFAVVEGIFFSASFCGIFWFKKRGLMPGLAYSNELISRDEGLHVDFACLLYSKFDPLPDQTILEIVNSALEIERAFVREALPTNLRGMNADVMIQYVNFVADRTLVELGVRKTASLTNPFDFMNLISLHGKSQFFERRVAEYNDSAGSMNNHDGSHKPGSIFNLKEF